MKTNTARVMEQRSQSILWLPAGAVIGLAYIIALPCIGAACLVYFAGYRATQGIIKTWRVLAEHEAH